MTRMILLSHNQSVTQDKKSVNFLHTVISLIPLLRHFEHAAEVD